MPMNQRMVVFRNPLLKLLAPTISALCHPTNSEVRAINASRVAAFTLACVLTAIDVTEHNEFCDLLAF